ncbi:MAG: glycine betaine/L-proline ABC transporter substrate-binding protein ProX [Dehalococcoidia bacterium]|nr:glycine betaine/L-proline ABC transporter substrate-binding protein ProX [Dehalococcoidia bacterium]MCB9483613.1 glycine betaine/L-proline ABC transporter substrate-binding protein ProX [Dehalococcoidia bacterium]
MLVAACSDDSGSEDATSEPTTSGETTETGTPTSTEAGGETSNAMPGEGVSVQPARATWNTGYFQEAIYSAALEDLGYDVAEAQELDNPIFYQSVAAGDVDFWANGWFPLHNQYEETFSQGAEIAGTVAVGGALEGYLIDKAGAEEFGITTLADFERPEVKEAYDADGDGKADLHACPEGWGCNTVIGHHLDDLGLRDHINEITAGYSASMADAVARYEDGGHILFYTWTPNWTVNVLAPGEDVVWIGLPQPSYPEEIDEDRLTISGVAGAVSDPLLMGFPANDINVVANSQFLDENPAAAKMFELIQIPLEDIFAQNAQMNDGEDSQDDIDRQAREWIQAHQSDWDAWLAEARAAAEM